MRDGGGDAPSWGSEVTGGGGVQREEQAGRRTENRGQRTEDRGRGVTATAGSAQAWAEMWGLGSGRRLRAERWTLSCRRAACRPVSGGGGCGV